MTDLRDAVASAVPVGWKRTEARIHPDFPPRVDFTADPVIAEMWRGHPYTEELEPLVPLSALDTARAEIERLREALGRIADDMPGIRAPHRMSAARALAKNTLMFRAGAASEWLPIETAPRDGTRVLVAGDPDNPTPMIGWRGDDIVTPGCFDTSYGNWWPTHWRPLPAPPAIRALPLTEGGDNLENCPFCGGEARHYEHPDHGGWSNTDSVSCMNEDCGCGTCLHENKAAAIAAWNRRAASSTSEAEPVAEVVKMWTRKDGYNGKGIEWRLEPVALPLGAKLYTLPTPASDDQVEAVRWYGERASALASRLNGNKLSAMSGSDASYVEAVLVELTLDAGRRAAKALAAMGSTKPAPRGEEG